MKKKFLSIFIVVATLLMFGGCSSLVNEPCSYCHNSPSKAYKKSDGSTFYVCEECSSECMICSREKATHHYESLLGIVFVCDDCYEMATK